MPLLRCSVTMLTCPCATSLEYVFYFLRLATHTRCPLGLACVYTIMHHVSEGRLRIQSRLNTPRSPPLGCVFLSMHINKRRVIPFELAWMRCQVGLCRDVVCQLFTMRAPAWMCCPEWVLHRTDCAYWGMSMCLHENACDHDRHHHGNKR